MRLSGQFEVSFFFLQKDFERTKSQSIKMQNNQFPPLRSFYAQKNCCLCCFLNACLCFFWLVLVDLRFSSIKIFSLKKKLAENCPDILRYYTSDVYPPQLAYREFICTHFFYLRSSSRISPFYENLFYL